MCECVLLQLPAMMMALEERGSHKDYDGGGDGGGGGGDDDNKDNQEERGKWRRGMMIVSGSLG